VFWLLGLLNEYLSEGDLAAADGLDGDVAGVDDAASQEEDATTDDRSVNVLQNCFATILDTLASNNPRSNAVSVLGYSHRKPNCCFSPLK